MDSNLRSRHGETPFGRHWFPRTAHQLGEALIRRGTKNSNPASSSGESASHRFLSGGAKLPTKWGAFAVVHAGAARYRIARARRTLCRVDHWSEWIAGSPRSSRPTSSATAGYGGRGAGYARTAEDAAPRIGRFQDRQASRPHRQDNRRWAAFGLTWEMTRWLV